MSACITVETAQSTLRNSKTCSSKRLLFIRWELFAIKIGCHSHQRFINTHINIRVLYFILVVSTVHRIVKRKVTVFCNIFVIMYCTVVVVVATVHSCPSLAQKNWSIFDCFTSFLVAWSTLYILWISHTLTACKPWCCYTSNCSNKRCACSNKRRIYKKKKIGSFFVQPKLLE